MPVAVELASDTLTTIDQQNGEVAIRRYSERLKHVESSGPPIFNRQPFPWNAGLSGADQQSARNEEVVRVELERDLGLKVSAQQDGGDNKTTQASVQHKCVNGTEATGLKTAVPPRALPLFECSPTVVPASAGDSDTEGETLPCCRCGLPIGDISYTPGDVSGGLRFRSVHGECLAQRAIFDMRMDDRERRSKEAAMKNSRRQEFDIGWKIASVPSNMGPAEKMGCQFVPQGMCCLVLHEETRTVSVIPTLEPAGSVNLAYLSIALKVRRHDCREPLFSLDPVNPGKKDSMQHKRFEPEWLVSTCVGDVLFQADYYLKELSMGEYNQPVVGMRSCFDYDWDEGHDKDWRAREWFVVRKAEVHISEDNVLIPFVRMGVEAWEQLVASDGELNDVKVTRRDHPLVQYAQAFTNNFDLIAERKSVIFHLRELARASVLAKYLVETQIHVPEVWFSAAGLTDKTVAVPKSLEIPQLWNERAYSKIRLENGTLVDFAGRFGTKMHGLYGGVSFGLDRFKVASHGRAASTLVSGIAPSRFSQARAGLAAPGYMPPRAAISRADPRGVDLNLDSFDLSKAQRVASHVTALEVGEDACVALGADFWSNLDSSNGSVFKDDDRLLLAALFNPRMTDRRNDGDKFVPPDSSHTYLERMSNLMKQEDRVRLERQERFFSKKFVAADPGQLFPSFWKNYIEIDRKATGTATEGMLHERPDYKAEAHIFEYVLPSVAPVFDKCTEEGMRFRVYKIGSLEVRTTQAVDEKEIVGAVFSCSQSTYSPMQGQPVEKTKATDQITKVTMYVERNRRLLSSHHYYVVMETEEANFMVAEMNSDGSVTWKENPVDLDVRNSLAKAFRAKDCRDITVNIRQVKGFSFHPVGAGSAILKPSTGKRYAQGLYDRACGKLSSPSDEMYAKIYASCRAALTSKEAPASTGVARAPAREGSVWEGLALQARSQRKERGYSQEESA